MNSWSATANPIAASSSTAHLSNDTPAISLLAAVTAMSNIITNIMATSTRA